MRRRPVFLTLAVLVVAVVLVFVVTRPAGVSSPSSSVRSAAAFRLPDLLAPADTVALGDREERPAVVNFLAAWCIPCRDELPELEAAFRRVGSKVAFIGVDHQDSRNAALDLLDELDVTFPVGYDPKGLVAERYLVRGLPTTVFIAADGREVGRVAGRLRADDLEQWIDRLG